MSSFLILMTRSPNADIATEFTPNEGDHKEGLPSVIDMLQNLRTQQSQLFPHQSLPSIDETVTKQTKLCLPSEYSPQERSVLGLTEAAEAEIQLRRSHAFDILRSLREWIHLADYITITKNLGPLVKETRSYTLSGLKAAEQQKERLLRRYQYVFDILATLDATQGLFPLTLDDLWVKTPFRPHQVNDSSKHNPWYWATEKLELTTQSTWVIEGSPLLRSTVILKLTLT